MSELQKSADEKFNQAETLNNIRKFQDSPEPATGDFAANPALCENKPEPAEPTMPEYEGEFASEFKNLPAKWQVFLCKRESENKKKIADYCARLDAYKIVETLFGDNRNRMQERGFQTITQWLQGLAWLDMAMDENPHATIAAIAAVYGVSLPSAKQTAAASPVLMSRIYQLERNYHDLTSYLHQSQNHSFNEALCAFSRQTDKEGNLLHPYFEKVKQEICELLKSGVAPDMETAYESALWLNPAIRKELVQQHIDLEAKAADKAKQAVFAVRGRAEKPERELTLRETIAKNMAKYQD